MRLKASTLSESGFLTMMSSSSVKRFSPKLIETLARARMDWIRRFLACIRCRRSVEERISLGTLLGHSGAHPESNERQKSNNPHFQRSAFKGILPFSP